MATYKYKTEEMHQKHLQYRREYYAKNRDRLIKNTKARKEGNYQPKGRDVMRQRLVKPQYPYLYNAQINAIVAAIREEDQESLQGRG